MASMLSHWLQTQKQSQSSADRAASSVFYRNIEDVLNSRRAKQSLYTFRKRGGEIDFSSNDFLSLATTGQLRTALFEELAQHPDFEIGSKGPRLFDGNNDYIEQVEREIAEFHGAESAIIVNSGFEGNVAIFQAIPRQGDAIVYDELVHASTHDGMAKAKAELRLPFRHNDLASFKNTLTVVRDSQPLIRDGERCVLIAVESIYSMDGDVAPLAELVQIAKELFPAGNAQFVVDEAHATGILGPKGEGLVTQLGLESEIAVRMYTFGKTMASTGAAILGSESIKLMLINNARSLIFTTAPSFVTLATIRASYKLIASDAASESRAHIQSLVKRFFTLVSQDAAIQQAMSTGIIRLPVYDGWDSRPFQTQICPVVTKADTKYNFFLIFQLQLSKFCAFPIDFPVVPKGQSRVRLCFHATNSLVEVDGLVAAISTWSQEMLDIESGKSKMPIPSATAKVYAFMATAGANATNDTTGVNGVKAVKAVDGDHGVNGVKETNGANGVEETNGTNGVEETNGTNGVNNGHSSSQEIQSVAVQGGAETLVY